MDSDPSKKFQPLLSIHYPGVVKNVSNMLDTLGGIRMISLIHSEKNRKLELMFRPEDVFCKPAYGTRRPVAGLVLKIKIKKNEKKVVSCEALGCVTEEFRFTSLCDFQFLATTKNECAYDKIVPTDLNLDWLSSSSFYFLPPAAFSRIDSVQNFNFSKIPVEEDKPNVIGRLKRKRYGCTKCLTFDNPEVPTLPKSVPTGGMCPAKLVSSDTMEHLKALFKERPIYSKSAIKCISKLQPMQLKCLLPCVAYYFVNGPWRSLWVRFGYDPRKDPSARIYQTLDYRVRSNLSKDEVKNKRSSTTTSFSYKFSNQGVKNYSVITKIPTEVNDKEEKEESEEYIFRPEMIPPSRQYYYQYCDIHLPEVKTMLENWEMPEDRTACHEIDGWLPPSMADKCRDIMNRYVMEEVKRRNKLSHHPTPGGLIVEAPTSFYSGSDSDFSDPEQF